MTGRFRVILVNGGLVVGSLLLSLLLAELICRMLTGDGEARVLYYSPQAMIAGPEGAVHYRPSSRVRSKAVYGGIAEYEVSAPINDLGYIDSVDYHRVSADRAVAVVGDSLTAGYHGGEPWVPKLRAAPELKGRAVYNLGMEGVGTRTFLANLRRAERRLAFDTVLMVGIGPDFTRVPWHPVERGGLMWLCPSDQSEEDCLATPTDLRILDFATPSIDASAGSPRLSLSYRLRQVVRAIFPSLSTLQRNLRTSIQLKAEIPDAARRDFADFRQWGGNRTLVFLHVPLREETERRSFLTPLREIAEAHGIRYVSGLDCGFTPKDYFPRDGHPNAAGYDRLRACAAAALAPVLH